MSKKILFNALQASPTGTGISRYATELARALVRLRDDVVVVARQSMANEFGIDPSQLIVYENPGSSWRRILVEQLSLPGKTRNVRLVHHPDCMVSLFSRTPCVMTVHDLTFFRHPETFTRMRSAWKRFISRRSARKALRVLCDSENTADDARRYLRVSEEKLRVGYPGVTTYAGKSQPPKAMAGDFPFVLAVGTLEPRKNVPRLIRALALLRSSGHDCKLALAGKAGWLAAPIAQTLRDENLKNHVIFCGYCSDAELKWLYENAMCLAYVSLYEGFGIPPLEAMAYGLPVVASNTSSIPEVCGDAAQYVDPYSVEDIARGINEVCADESLRKRLVEVGKQRASLFDWDRAAAVVSTVYDEL